jgi:long-chain-alcohol oxidase
MALEGEEREKAAAGAGRRRGHALLRGWKRDRYTHGMHPGQMEALRAMCGALIPSLPADIEGHGRGDPPGGKDLERFYQASAGDSIIPDEVTRPVFSISARSLFCSLLVC